MRQRLVVRVDSKTVSKSGEITFICALYFEMADGS